MTAEVDTQVLKDDVVLLSPINFSIHHDLIVSAALKYKNNDLTKEQIEQAMENILHGWLASFKGVQFQVFFIGKFLGRFTFDSYLVDTVAKLPKDDALGLRSAKLVLAWFDEFYNEELFSYPDVRNKAARKSIERLGFKFVEVFMYLKNRHSLMRRKPCHS